MKHMIILISSLIFGAKVFATGGTVGNGGDVAVCPGSVELLDTYEARTLRGFGLDLGNPSLSVDQKIALAVTKIFSVDPYRAIILKASAEKFMNETKFLRGIALRDIDDSDEVFLPAGCERRQIAIQNTRVVWDDPFYVVDQDLWDRLDNDNKAALILHEVIFRASRAKWPSPTVRFLNSVAFSTLLRGKTKADYYQYVYSTPLMSTVNAGIGSDGRWYFQIPDIAIPFDQFMTGLNWERQTAHGSWDFSCRTKMSAKPITSQDLPEVFHVMMDQFGWGEINLEEQRTRSVFAIGNKSAVELYDVDMGGSQLLNRDSKAQGEVWCVSDHFPSQWQDLKY
jgi:hypothetical protein